MADRPLKDEETLAESEESTALLGAVSDATPAGEVRNQTIAQRAESLHRQNPMEVMWEPTTLFEDLTSDAPLDNDFSETYNLDFKSGNSGPRRDFSDGYAFFEIYFAHKFRSTSSNDFDSIDLDSKEFNAHRMLNSTEDAPLVVFTYGQFAGSGLSRYLLLFTRNSDTSFKIATRQIDESPDSSSTNMYINRIVGWKMVIRPSSMD